MALKSTSKQMCVYIFIVNTYEVGHLYLTIKQSGTIFFYFFYFFSMRIVNVIATHRPPVSSIRPWAMVFYLFIWRKSQCYPFNVQC